MMKSARPMSPADGIAWVTGASSGIGCDIALRLAREGWTVAATARTQGALDHLAAEAAALAGRIVPYPADITDRRQIESVTQDMVSDHGPLALVVLNAGVYLPVDMIDLDLDRFDLSVSINLQGTANCIAAAMRKFREHGRGQIALVSSVTGYGGLPTCSAYGATKAALINMAECMAIELEPHGVLVHIVNPGFVDTPAQEDLHFPKPFMLSSEEAAMRIVNGLKRDKFEITFPRRFTFALKFLNNFLPKGLYLRLVRRQTLKSS